LTETINIRLPALAPGRRPSSGRQGIIAFGVVHKSGEI
jgi:hypothetical protein